MVLQVIAFLLSSGIAAAQVSAERDIVYARYGGIELKLDLYRPEPLPAGPLPGIVAIRGGGWRMGDKNGFSKELAARGFAVACIEYRVLPEWKFPAAVHDAKAAVRWMRAEGRRYGINSNAIGAIGGSAGGHLAALLGTSFKLDALEGAGGNLGVSSRVQAVVALAPVTDFRTYLDRGGAPREFLGGTQRDRPEVYQLASPLAHVDAGSAPFLFLHSIADKVIPHGQSTRMREMLEAAGVRADIFLFDNAPHAFWNDPEFASDAWERAAGFFHSVLDAIRPPAAGTVRLPPG